MSVEVVPINLDSISIDAGQRLGMIFVQPEYELLPDGEIPFKIYGSFRSAQNDLISRAFQIRAKEMLNRSWPVPFILFPELSISISNPDGMATLQCQLSEAEGEVIFIGGLEGLSFDEITELCDRFPPPDSSLIPQDNAGGYINVCLIVIKAAAGEIRWYYQAKLRPSPREHGYNMAEGTRVLYFTSAGLSFLCQICFDQIATEGESLNDIIYKQLGNLASPNAAKLDFIFVPQFNKDPNHDEIKKSRKFLLNYETREFNSSLTTIVNINKAADSQESIQYGRCGLHYKSNRWALPKNWVGPIGYELYEENQVTSAVFRKRTPGIHAANITPPVLNDGGSGEPRMPLKTVRCYLVTNGCDPTPCSCLPITACDVGAYVECYCLPCKLRDTILSNYPASDQKKRWHDLASDPSPSLIDDYLSVRRDVLTLSSSRSREIINMLLLMHSSEDGYPKNPDLWKPAQEEALIELFAALSTLKELSELEFNTESLFSVQLNSSTVVVFLDGKNDCHSITQIEKEYIEQFEVQLRRSDYSNKRILLIGLRSRGSATPLVRPAEQKYLKHRNNGYSTEQPITAVRPLQLFVSRNTLFENARCSESISDYLRREMTDVL